MRHHPSDTDAQRLLRPLSTNWVCAEVGVSRQTVADWRAGRNQPTEPNWERLLGAVLEAVPDANTKEEAPEPDWVRGLRREIVLNRAVIQAAFTGRDPDFVEKVMARLGSQLELPTKPDDEPPGLTNEEA